MVVPAKRLSRARSRKRRFQKEKLELLPLQKCKNCGDWMIPHRVCPNCGFYKGRFVMSFKKEKGVKNK